LSGSPEEALTQRQYDTMRSLQDVLELIAGSEHALGFARQQLAIWESIARRLRDGTAALVVTHGGNIILPAALLARRLGTDVAPLPLSYLEGLRVDYSQRRCRALHRLPPTATSPALLPSTPPARRPRQGPRAARPVPRRTR